MIRMIVVFLLLSLTACAIPLKVSMKSLSDEGMKREEVLRLFKAKEEKLILLSFDKVKWPLSLVASWLTELKLKTDNVRLELFLKYVKKVVCDRENLAPWYFEKYYAKKIRGYYHQLKKRR